MSTETPTLNRQARRHEDKLYRLDRKPGRNLPLGFDYDALPRQEKRQIFMAGFARISELRKPQVEKKHQMEFKTR